MPSNDFGGQEPGGVSEITETAQHQYGVNFPIAAKTVVKGPNAHPFYKWAAAARPNDTPRWNFHKYLVGRDGYLADGFADFDRADRHPDQDRGGPAVVCRVRLYRPTRLRIRVEPREKTRCRTGGAASRLMRSGRTPTIPAQSQAGSRAKENTMRVAAGLLVAGAVSAFVVGRGMGADAAHRGHQPATAAATVGAAPQPPAPAPAAAPAPPAPLAAVKTPCANPDALGIGRVVEIDTTGGPGFGFEHFKQLDFLRDKEVVLTFDDGPWPVNTPAVLKALADECTKAIFFPIGKHATYYPEILKQVAAAGHTIGAHTWSHANLNNKKLTEQQRKDEIEKGFSAVKWAIGGAPAPFFRFPALQHPPDDGDLSRQPQHRDVLLRSRLASTSRRSKAETDRRHRDGQAREERQGHHPDARLPEAHRRKRCRRCCAN